MAVHSTSHTAAGQPAAKRSIKSRLSGLWMFFLGWFGISGFLVSTSTCPFCGQTGCPVGVGQAAGIGFLSSFFIWLTGRRKTLPTQEEPHRHEPPAGENDGSPREE